MVIFNTCRNPEAAWSVLKTLLTEEADLDFMAISGQLPRRKDLNTNPLFTSHFSAHPEMLPFARQAAYLRGMDMEPYMKEVLDLISQEYEICVVYGLKTPEEAIADAAKAVELLYLD
jgi:multiple sugar transport system substrate-binding protein